MTQMPRRSTKRTAGVGLGLLCILTLAGCAMTDEARFPLDTPFADRLWADVELARQALPAYQRMGSDYERQGRFRDAAIAYSNASQVARVVGRLQDAVEVGQKAADMAERANIRTMLPLLSFASGTRITA